MTLHPSAVSEFLDKHLKSVFAQPTFSESMYKPICLWGEAGIGKTQLVKALAKKNGYAFQLLSLAQIEETGDVLGLPFLDETAGVKRTLYAKPAWVPDEPGPGILLIDDFNRADPRILHALMELFQFYQTSSWTLPEKWFIILTANPSGKDYFVQKVDQAILDRMLHIEVDFDLESWLHWAESEAIDDQLLLYPILFPEQFNAAGLSPRTWTALFIQLSQQANQSKDYQNVLVHSVLPDTEAAFFISYLHQKNQPLIGLDQLAHLDQIHMDAYLEHIQEQHQQPLLLNAIGRALIRAIAAKKIAWEAGQVPTTFWLSKHLPNDVRLEQLAYMRQLWAKHINLRLELPKVEQKLLENWN